MDYIQNCHPMFSFERELWDDGVFFIAGIDEAGRGPLAGPVVAAAVIVPKGVDFPPVNDSKKLTDKRRRELRSEIISVDGVLFSIAEVSADEIERINILKATHSAMKKAVQNLNCADYALIDGLPVPRFPVPCKAIVKGDSKSVSIAAASILAKVHRDELMERYAVKYPQYGFEKNKGYGTAAHIAALKEFGPCPIHRKTFAPVRELQEKSSTKIQPEFDLL
jgi:ribonuclease HII